VARTLRVVIDARIRAEVSGGVQQWIIGLAHAIADLDGPEEYLFLVESPVDHWLAPYLRGRCRFLPRTAAPKAGRRARWIRSLRRRLRGPTPKRTWDGTIHEARADVVHFPTQIAFRTSIPSIYQPWDLQHVHLPEFFTPEAIAARELAYRTYCAQAALVVTASSWVKEDLIREYGIAADRIAVVNVPPAIEAYPEPTPAETSAITTRLSLLETFVFYPAQTWGHKNHLRLFEALASLRTAGVTVPLICTGHLNESYPALAAAAERLGIADQVRFLGFVEPAEVRVLYSSARALVYPSLFEGWGLPILEAFASDLPVACSNVTSLPELVGDAAIVFDPYDTTAIADAIARLWTDDGLAAELRIRGRARLADFDWHRTALTMRDLYRKVARV
jgi:glycosyltransferase involved in cell wall biosynthesis